MRRRWFIPILTLALAAAYACSFPSITFNESVEAGTAHDAALADAPSTAPNDTGTDAPLDGEDGGEIGVILIDGGVFDSSAFDAGTKVDTTGCTTCDCDHDTYLNNDAGCNPAPGQLDCDDSDGRTHPNQVPLDQDAEPPRNGDWNCDGNPAHIITESFSCDSVSAFLNDCTKYGGFVSVVPCGQKGTYITCKPPGGLLGALSTCATNLIGSATQYCQ